jgi:Arc/MetJ family transcription regulator
MNMRTTLDIDDKLLGTVMKLTSASSKKDAIETALREFLRTRRREELSLLIGQYDDFGLSLKTLKKMRRGD